MTTSSEKPPVVLTGRAVLLTILLAFVAFISLGMPDGLLGVAWPFIRATFGLPIDSLGALMVTGTLGYLISAFSSGRVIPRLGVGALLALSCATTATALLGYGTSQSWPLFVALGILGGLGAGAIDAGLNTYVAAHHGPRLMQWLHASFGVGSTLGPFIMTTVLTAGQPWRLGYIVVGMAQIGLAIAFLLTANRWAGTPQNNGEKKLTEYKTSFRHSMSQPRVWVSMLLFLLYTGLEVTPAQWSFSLMTEMRQIPIDRAGYYVSGYWGAFTVGRIVAGVVAHRIRPVTLLRLGIGGAIVGGTLFWWNPSELANAVALMLIGFSIAPIFPAMVTTTAERVGVHHAANTIGFQMGAASVGFITIAGSAGLLARQFTLEILPPYMLLVMVLYMTIHTIIFRRPIESSEQSEHSE